MTYPTQWLCLFSLIFLFSCSEPELDWQEVTTEGIPKTITLADGSTVHLNANSYLKYPKEFLGSVRKVEMEGEAYFTITKGENTFIVNTNHARIAVLGTQFNVNTKATPTGMEVNVNVGVVELQPLGGGGKVELSPNIKGFFDYEKKELGRIRKSTGNDMFWHTKTLNFDETFLNRALDEIGTALNVEISVTNPELLKCTFTGSFPDPKMEDLLAAFEKAYGADTFKEDDVYYSIIGGTCP